MSAMDIKPTGGKNVGEQDTYSQSTTDYILIIDRKDTFTVQKSDRHYLNFMIKQHGQQ